jgi:chitinase
MSAMQLDPEIDPTASHEMLGKFNVNDAVEEYKKVGVPAAKIVIGVPLYGRMSNITDIGESYGLYRTITTGTPAGEYDDGQSGATGMFDYKCIVDHNRCYGTSANHLAGMVLVDFTTNSYGQYSKTPWGYNSTGGKSQFITYDDEKSMEYKAAWVKQNKLGGVMLWELSGDMPASSPKSLVNSAQKILGGE